MGIEVSLTRAWIVLLYVLATLLAQSTHDHGRGDDESSFRHEEGCSDPRPHVAGHASPDLSHEHDGCLACQFRVEHQGCILTPFYLERPIASGSTDYATLFPPASTLRRNNCRAPPEREIA